MKVLLTTFGGHVQEGQEFWESDMWLDTENIKNVKVKQKIFF